MKRNGRVGIMLACGTLKRIDWLKSFILDMERMGYDMLQLEITANYKIENEPYFGYLLGGYTTAELRELDEFAAAHGIELVPCIQTLGHLDDLERVPEYYPLFDIGGVLMIDEPRVYELIENMFKALRAGFSSKMVNIGYDEAHFVGRGKYLDKHGYVRGFDLLLKHLERVKEIAERYGFHVQMWSDMFVRMANGGSYYGKNIRVPQDVLQRIPNNVDLIYWDYGEHEIEEEFFDEMFKTHLEFPCNQWYASCAWLWMGFTPMNRFSLYAGECAMRSARKNGVKNYLVTVWGNGGNEGAFYSILPALYAFRQYIDGNFDLETIARGFKCTFGVNFEEFITLDLPNRTSKNVEYKTFENASKTLLYCDPFLGCRDYEIKDVGHIPYVEYAQTLRATAVNMGKYAAMFEMQALFCDVLEIKGDLGVRTREAYRSNNRAALTSLLDDYVEAARRVERFTAFFKAQWLKENVGFGWELHQVRLGGLQTRLMDCRDRLKEYLDGRAERIAELEEEILPFGGSLINYGYWEIASLRRV